MIDTEAEWHELSPDEQTKWTRDQWETTPLMARYILLGVTRGLATDRQAKR